MSSDLNNENDKTEQNEFKEAVAPLTDGFLHIYKPQLAQVQKLLTELTETENVLFNEIHNENLSLAEVQFSEELNEIFGKIEIHQNRLLSIKKEMKSLHDKSIKLKKRALKIQQFREKQDYIKQQKEAELKAEQDLIGTPGSSSPKI